MRRASVETIERMVTSKADQARGRRVSLTIMNCIWARNTEQETSHPVHGEVIGKQFFFSYYTVWKFKKLSATQFYMKSILAKLDYQKLPFSHFRDPRL